MKEKSSNECVFGAIFIMGVMVVSLRHDGMKKSFLVSSFVVEDFSKKKTKNNAITRELHVQFLQDNCPAKVGLRRSC